MLSITLRLGTAAEAQLHQRGTGAMKRIGLAVLLVAAPAGAQESDPPNLFFEDGAYNMQVACPTGGQEIEQHRLLICIEALKIKSWNAEAKAETLTERVDELEKLIMAIGKD